MPEPRRVAALLLAAACAVAALAQDLAPLPLVPGVQGVPLQPPTPAATGAETETHAPTSPPIPGTLLGCFRDDAASRVLDGYHTQIPAMTPLACIAECRSRGYTSAGTQAGDQCFCGHAYDRLGSADTCNVPCDGDASQTCGGALANAVYATGFGRADITSASRIFAAPAASALAPGFYDGVDIQGPVLRSFPLSYPRIEICAQACLVEPGCAGFSFVRAGGYAVADPPTCYLRTRVDGTSQNVRVTSGVLK
ncbi:MAG: hypothetical protein HY854_03355 [Burkholderiales bacterium]|nr:hypothetical protein [Burkholderiales bacterium]